MESKKCDICRSDYNCKEVFAHLQTDKVKVLCYYCAEIVNEGATEMHAYAEKIGARVHKKMIKRIRGLEDEATRVKLFWFLGNIRGFFKKRVVQKVTVTGRA